LPVALQSAYTIPKDSNINRIVKVLNFVLQKIKKVLYKSPIKKQQIDQGKFKILVHDPGYAIPGHDDHGYGPLATIGESYMAPDTWIRMHAHHNDEIISWVPDGVRRHYDSAGRKLVTDRDHIMIMNAGR
jgi:hypothetical protein